MKYKVGDKVRIKSIDWYNENKDSNGNIVFSSKVTHFSWRENVRTVFTKDMSKFCGKVVTIETVWTVNYSIVEGTNIDYFTDEMIEGLVEEETKNLTAASIPDGPYTVTYDSPSMNDSMNKNDINNEIILPKGYIFKDENGNVINATKIVLEKKKKEYPKTLKECRRILDIDSGCLLASYDLGLWKGELLDSLQKLLICRDAYWKIAGEEMGLGRPWEPDLTDNVTKHCIEFRDCGVCKVTYSYTSRIFAFPTKEMRDAFKENFDPDIEFCKELL